MTLDSPDWIGYKNTMLQMGSLMRPEILESPVRKEYTNEVPSGIYL